MGYEEVSGNVLSFTGDEAIEKVEGLYKGCEKHHGTFEGQPTESWVHTFDNDGEIVSVYGKGQLDYKLKNVSEGTWCRVTHQGLEGRYHQFKLEVDKSRSVKTETATEPTDEEMPI
jgi:hypothetical protein